MKSTGVLAVVCTLIACFAGHATPRILDRNQHQHAVCRNHDYLYERRLQLAEDPQSTRFVHRCLDTAWNSDMDEDDDHSAKRQLLVDKQYVFGQEENELCKFLRGKHVLRS